MGRRILRVASVVGLVACTVSLSALAASEGSGLGGWIVPWDLDAGLQSLARSSGSIDEVFLFAARFDPAGTIVLDERKAANWPDAVKAARAAGARVWVTIVNDVVRDGSSASVLKDPDLVHEILASSERSAAHRADIVNVAVRLGVAGVDLDYENLATAERERFSSFVGGLADDLHGRGLALSVTVQAKTGESSSRGPGAMDWSALCSAADRIQVMLYNQHNASTAPGPIASIDWVGRVADYGLKICPAASIVPVLKVSGMDWGPDRADWVSFGEASSIIARVKPRLRRERPDRVPWFAYPTPEGRHVVYYEDAQSLSAKADVLRRRGLSRIMLWSLGSEDPETAVKIGSRTTR